MTPYFLSVHRWSFVFTCINSAVISLLNTGTLRPRLHYSGYFFVSTFKCFLFTHSNINVEIAMPHQVARKNIFWLKVLLNTVKLKFHWVEPNRKTAFSRAFLKRLRTFAWLFSFFQFFSMSLRASLCVLLKFWLFLLLLCMQTPG